MATIAELETKYMQAAMELEAARQALPLEPIPDYELATTDGPKLLSALFGEREDMLLIHNMGRGCNYCSLWADGLNGYLPMLYERAAVVLLSPDPIERMRETACQRGWDFVLASDASRELSTRLGFFGEHGALPGASGLRKGPEGISRKSSMPFGPGDQACPVWPLFGLLEGGAAGWEPKH